MNTNSHFVWRDLGIPHALSLEFRAAAIHRVIAALVCIVTVSVAPSARAQQFESARIPPPEITTNNSFGSEVAISGLWALVGDFAAGTAGTKGEAYFYRRDPGGWALKQSVRGTQSSRLGQGLALDGETAVIGVPTWDWAGSRTGKVLVHELREEKWVRVQELHPPGLGWYDLFGRSVGISGDVIVIGASGVDRNVPNSGALFVYERRAGHWDLIETFYLPRNKDTLYAHKALGSSVAIDGDRIVAGAPWGFGGAYVYERGMSAWSEVAVLVDETRTAWDFFGTSVDIFGDVIVVGEPAKGSDGNGYRPGSVFVYERDLAGNWNLVRELQASDGFGGPDFGDKFGSSVAVEGDRIVVGATSAKNWAKLDGKGYLFEREPTGAWPITETVQLLATKPSFPKQDSTGAAAAMDDGFILLGAPNSEGGGVYVFEVELGTRYCFQSPNSTGEPARLTVTGTGAASARALTLSVRDCPPGIPGLFLLSSGRERQLIKNGDGWLELCLGPEIRRTSPTAMIGPGGVAIQALNYDDPWLSGSLLMGTTWYFQFAYRDGPWGVGFNLSNAVAVTLE